MTLTAEQRTRQGNLAVNLGLLSNILLAGLKTSIGILGRSPALLAEGIHSTSDVAYYIIVAVFLRVAGKPADDEHPYGHSQLESVASLVVGAFIVTTAIAIFWDAVNTIYKLFSGQSQFSGAELIALWIALLTVGAKIGLSIVTRRIGERINNPVVLSLAFDHRNDVLSASAVAIGIYLGRGGYPWIDPFMGAVVAVLILRTGVIILRQSSDDLMGSVPSRALAKQVTALVALIPGVESVEEIRAQRFGPYLVINLTIGVEGQLTVEAGDCIATQVEDVIYNSMDLVRRVYVHYHPTAARNPGSGSAKINENASAVARRNPRK